MAYDEHLASRVRAELAEEDAVTEKAMFGGLAFMVAGHMACGIVGNELMLRLGKEAAEHALAREHVRRMDFTGRHMGGMVFVGADGLEGAALDKWIQDGRFVRSLPPKK